MVEVEVNALLLSSLLLPQRRVETARVAVQICNNADMVPEFWFHKRASKSQFGELDSQRVLEFVFGFSTRLTFFDASRVACASTQLTFNGTHDA